MIKHLKKLRKRQLIIFRAILTYQLSRAMAQALVVVVHADEMIPRLWTASPNS
jgi:hypothetical protein